MKIDEVDRIWYGALGFSYVEKPQIIHGAVWEHRGLGIVLRLDQTQSEAVKIYTQKVRERAIRSQQLALREALMPAMGLHLEYPPSSTDLYPDNEYYVIREHETGAGP